MVRAKSKVKNAKRELKCPLGYVNPQGYLMVAVCFKDKNGIWQAGHRPSHREIARWGSRRVLTSNDCVHHRDNDKMNNFIGNLDIVSRKDHGRITMGLTRARKAKRAKNFRRGVSNEVR